MADLSPEQRETARDMVRVRFFDPPTDADVDRIVAHWMMHAPLLSLCGERFGSADEAIARISDRRRGMVRGG